MVSPSLGSGRSPDDMFSIIDSLIEINRSKILLLESRKNDSYQGTLSGVPYQFSRVSAWL
jgi:hypothetical protein